MSIEREGIRTRKRKTKRKRRTKTRRKRTRRTRNTNTGGAKNPKKNPPPAMPINNPNLDSPLPTKSAMDRLARETIMTRKQNLEKSTSECFSRRQFN